VNCEEGHLDVLPIALNPSIQRLVIKNNKIRIIDSSIQFYSELTLLDLSFNYLFNIPDRTFAGIENLKTLNLADNRFVRVPSSTLAVLRRLEELAIGQNHFETVPAHAFR
ncbi:AGAP011370-PA, partial [Anopheles gambiae str. PEST]